MAVGGTLWTTANQTAEAGSAFDKGRLAVRDNYIRGLITPESPIFFRAHASGMNVGDWQNLILVKENGKRFWDELDSSYDGYFAHAMAWTGDPAKLNGGGPIWAIFDAAAVKREKWSTEPPVVDREHGYLLQRRYARRAGQSDDAQSPPVAAHAWRRASRDGRTVQLVRRLRRRPDFKRRKPPYKIETPPFYAAWATPSLHDSLTGVRTNTRCQVMTATGEIDPGAVLRGRGAGRIRAARPRPMHHVRPHRRHGSRQARACERTVENLVIG